ncbi:MAG: alpha/beta fold hydrolase [Oligoflexus sp.]|nr:alpha/beta fold hydrolase [Oligoflexus sp.]
MAVLERESGKIFYSVQGKGKGETLLMLRGLGRSSRYWLGFDSLMAHYFQVVTIDQRGLGRSTQPMEWSDSIDTLADDCLAVMDQLNIENFHMFGLSLGGMIGTSIASMAPDRVLSLVVGASSSADYKAFRLNPKALARLLFALRAGRFQDALLETVVPAMIMRSRGPELQASWQKILDQEGFPLLTVLKQIRASMSHRIKGRLDSSQYPVMFVHGSMDGFVPLHNSQRLQRLVPGSVLKIIKGAGHELALGFEQELSLVLREFTKAKA